MTGSRRTVGFRRATACACALTAMTPALAVDDPAMTAIEAHLWSCKSCRPEPADAD